MTAEEGGLRSEGRTYGWDGCKRPGTRWTRSELAPSAYALAHWRIYHIPPITIYLLEVIATFDNIEKVSMRVDASLKSQRTIRALPVSSLSKFYSDFNISEIVGSGLGT